MLVELWKERKGEQAKRSRAEQSISIIVLELDKVNWGKDTFEWRVGWMWVSNEEAIRRGRRDIHKLHEWNQGIPTLDFKWCWIGWMDVLDRLSKKIARWWCQLIGMIHREYTNNYNGLNLFECNVSKCNSMWIFQIMVSNCFPFHQIFVHIRNLHGNASWWSLMYNVIAGYEVVFPHSTDTE